jgi:cobalt-zinc-cadmium resistance protein CzcA
MITTPTGLSVPLEQVADINIEDGPNQIQREDAKRRITIAFNARGRDVQSIVEEVQKKADKAVKLPAGYYVKYGGQFENLIEAKQRLMIAVPAALLLILLILYFSFGSLRYGLLIYTAIPLSAIGGIILLWARDMPFSISAGVGFIALFGVAVLNGIVLISEFNRLKNETKLEMKELVLTGTSSRLRPVLMTAAVASLGFLPMALSQSSGAEVQRPLATVVIGGLISATLLTLFVLPVLYVWVEKRKQKFVQPVVASLLLAFIFSSSLQAQQIERISLDTLLARAERNVLSLKIADKQISYYNELKKGNVDIPRTSVGLEYGNINSAKSDTRFFISQQLQLPKVYERQKSYFDKSVDVQSADKSLKKSELRYQVRKLYYHLQDLERREIIIGEIEKNFKEFTRIAELQKNQGEIYASSFNLIQSQTAQLGIQKNELNVEKKRIQLELKKTLRIEDEILPIKGSEKPFDNFTVEKMNTASHPLLVLSEAMYQQKKSQTELDRNRLAPDLTLGYSNLSIIGWQTTDGVNQKYYGGGNRFGIYQIGLGLPIFNGAARAKIKASKINEEISLLEKQEQTERISMQLNQLVIHFNQLMEAFRYYEKEGVEGANKIMDQAAIRLKSGDIQFSEWLMMVNQSLQIKTAYIENLYLLSLTEAEYFYLIEKN